ncbi:MAG: hypothetical protein IKU45_00530 [Clostridia bacterium]|nr:hypothetical protein [Clostridia bacterium]
MNKKFILIMLLFSICLSYLLFLSGCEKEKVDIGEPNTTEYFSSMYRLYDFFFEEIKFVEWTGRKWNYIEADLHKESYGEKYYNFINNIQKGRDVLYYPVVSNEWSKQDDWNFIMLYVSDTPLMRPSIWFKYAKDGDRIIVKYTYLTDYEKEVVLGRSSKKTVRDLLYYLNTKEKWFSEEEYKKWIENSEFREFQLKNQTVNARVKYYENREKCDVDFIYDDVCVTVWNVASHLITDDFLKDFALEEYTPPVDTYIEEPDLPLETTNE